MATPKKLPSGQWRTQVYDYTDENGKRHYRSFTSPNKKISALIAAEFAANKKRVSCGNLTVLEAIEEYIRVKENVLSPSTIRGYTVIKNNHFREIENIYIRDITNEDVQKWINNLAKRLSSKTVSNAHGLLISAIDMFAPEIRIRAKLPRKKKSDLYVPSDTDVKKLLEHISGSELEIAVLLAAFGPMRRGEICALTSNDIHGNFIDINKSMVRSQDGKWIIKEPKTDSSYRTIDFPEFVINKLSGIDGRIIKVTPDTLTMQFERIFENIDIPKFRFHDLRHYSASIMHAIGIPDQYIMARGGWSTDGVMKSVYRNVIDEQTIKMNRRINDHFKSMQHDISHEFSEPL